MAIRLSPRTVLGRYCGDQTLSEDGPRKKLPVLWCNITIIFLLYKPYSLCVDFVTALIYTNIAVMTSKILNKIVFFIVTLIHYYNGIYGKKVHTSGY